MPTEFSNEDEHKKIMLSHDQLLWKIVSTVERIEGTLIGSAFTNNKGLVHKVEYHGDLLESIDKRVSTLEIACENDEKLEKKTHSVWSIVIAAVASVAAVVAAIFSASPKK